MSPEEKNIYLEGLELVADNICTETYLLRFQKVENVFRYAPIDI